MKWKSVCLEILDFVLVHNEVALDVQEFHEEIHLSWEDAQEVYDAYKKKISFKELMEKRDRATGKRFKKNFGEWPVGNDLRTLEGRLAYMKVLEEDTTRL